MIVLDATLHGEAITAARISLISRMPRTSVTRRVTKLQKLGILTVAPDGWRVSDAYMRRPGLREWVVRMEALVRRTHQAILSDSDS
ncbi:MAG: hypothetical protein K2Y29_08050 [Beijerinckiaceae bacterium]|nr:hypothetical protein [Beijerinckiaceae bacterium]